jgi:hypothetical protein
MLTGDALLAKVREGRELTITEPTKPLVSKEQSIARTQRETTITKEQLDQLWNALEYTRATIGSGYDFPSMEGKMDYQLIHKGRAHQSNDYLEQAIKIVNQMREELN